MNEDRKQEPQVQDAPAPSPGPSFEPKRKRGEAIRSLVNWSTPAQTMSLDGCPSGYTWADHRQGLCNC